MLRFRALMTRASLLIVGLMAGTCAAVSPAGAQRPRAHSVPEWNSEALFDSTTTREELLDMGRSAVSFSHFPLAEVYFQEALLRDPGNVDAMCELAHLYKRTGRLEYARGLLTRASTLAPARQDIVANLRIVEQELRGALEREIRTLLAAEHFEEALPRIAVLLSITPDNVDVLADKARCLARVGQMDAALSTIDLALSKAPREDLYALRAEFSSTIEHERIASMESSARRLIESGNWVRGEASDVLQAILAQDPSNEWAREQFRALSGTGSSAPAPRRVGPAWPEQFAGAIRDIAPGVAGFFDRHLTTILALIGVAIVFASPLARALARRVRPPSLYAGDLGQIVVADALRLASASGLSGVMVFHTPEGRAKVFLEDGEPVHCAGFGHAGVEAFAWLVEHVEEGSFELRPSRGSVERTIEQPLTLLLAGGPTTAADAEAVQRRRKSRMSELLETHTD
jgi:Flp pilus assembly protein TadD